MININRTFAKSILTEFLVISFGCVLYTLSVNIFALPYNIAPGGLTGLSILLNHLFSFPIGTSIVVMNIPLFAISFKYFGTAFIYKSLYATVFSSVLIDLTAPFLPQFNGEGLMAPLFGGVLSGFGMSFIFLQGGTTGGTDIASRILKRHFPFLSLGTVILVLDLIIIVASALVFKSINSALYATIMIFCSTTIIDKVLYGASSGKIMYIVSRKSDVIKDFILENLSRGVTVLNASGGFTMEPKSVLMCVVKRYESSRLKKAVFTFDRDAFVIVGEAAEIFGMGFNNNLE